MARIAPRLIHGIDPLGVRRRYPAGSIVPDRVLLEEHVPDQRTEPAEATRLRASKADRRGIVAPGDPAPKTKAKPKSRARKQA